MAKTEQANEEPIKCTISRLVKCANRSSCKAFTSLFVIAVLLAITAFVLVFARPIAQRDVAIGQEPIRERLIPVHLNDIASCRETVVAVGDDGAVSMSTDQSRSWENVENEFDRDFLAVAFSTDCSHIIAVGDGGALLESPDGGESWIARVGITENTINSVAVNEDGTTSVAVGRDGLFIASTRGGNWNKVTGLENGVANSVAIDGSGEIAVVTSRSDPVRVFQRGQDGKFALRSWSDREDDTRLNAAVVVGDGDQLSALFFGEDRAILAYTHPDDWDYLVSQDHEDRRDLLDVAVHDSKLIAVGRDGIQMASMDGMDREKWSDPMGPQGNDLNSVAMNEGGTAAVAVGDDGTVLLALTNENWWSRRFDGRMPWELINLHTTAQFSGVTFVSDNRFAVVGQKKSVQGNDLGKTSLYSCNLPDNLSATTAGQSAACNLVDGVGKMVKQEDESNLEVTNPSWWSDLTLVGVLQINVLRVGAITLFLFIASHLFSLARYYSRLSAYYLARADALRLSSREFSRPGNVVEVEQLMYALSPDHLEAKSPISPSSLQSMFQPLPGSK